MMPAAMHPGRPGTARDHSVFDAEIDPRKLSLGSMWRLARWIVPYRRQAFGAIALALLSASAAVLAPVIVSRVVVDGILLPEGKVEAPDYGQKALTANLVALSGLPPLAAACLIYVFWVSLWAVSGHYFRILLARTALQGLRDLRHDLFVHLEHLPSSFYDRVAVGRVMTRLTNDVETLFEMLAGFGVLVGEFVPFFVAATIMLSLDPSLTLDLATILPVVLVATYLFRQRSRKIYRDIRSSLSRLNENLHENLSGIEVVQLHGREEINFARYTAINQENRDAERRAIMVDTIYNPAMDSLAYLAMAAILWIGGHHALNGSVTLGSVILFAQFSDMLFRPIVAMGEQWNVVFRAAASSERIFQALDWKEGLKRPSNPVPLPGTVRGKIEFRHLTFGYRMGTPVLKDVNLTIEPGECVAVVGPTGSGKTSLIRLLCRFYDVPEGSILLDDIDIMRVNPASVRRSIGVVLQDFHIFSGTVFDNIAMGNPAVTRELAERAARMVNADGFIASLPDGFDTVLTERGRNLSQGQRQLLAFARVLALSPKILVLDEATASIDTETEMLIQAALARVKTGRTCVIIAHRLQTIQEADRIVVLDRGEIADIGSHRELMSRGGLYRTLYDLHAQETRQLLPV